MDLLQRRRREHVAAATEYLYLIVDLEFFEQPENILRTGLLKPTVRINCQGRDQRFRRQEIRLTNTA